MAIWRPKAWFLAVTLVLSVLPIHALAEQPDSQLDGIRVLLDVKAIGCRDSSIVVLSDV